MKISLSGRQHQFLMLDCHFYMWDDKRGSATATLRPERNLDLELKSFHFILRGEELTLKAQTE